ncbi:hypothetical protein [Microbacterium sp. WCS2018Hpa-23]|uniref:hypothetical protein n=1 Tax=Microbacterium sp. WCS2018Hpa-23 TaxID=3073634 RepID=UPI0028835483|nr:hypothetical protein [Microbacterium sp. WCS2018Hpa-23]
MSNRGRIGLIVGLIVAAFVIAGVLLFLLIPRGAAPDPAASRTPIPTESPMATSTPSPTASPSSTEEPAEPPVQTEAPPAVDPSVETFRGQVSGWLGDAGRGLELLAGLSGQDAASVALTLEEDAQRLSDVQAPSSIAAPWRDGVGSYAQSLADLRSAIDRGADTAAARSTAQSALQNVRAIVGL